MENLFIESYKNKNILYNFVEKFIDKIIINYGNEEVLGPEFILYIAEIIDTEFENQKLLNICNDLIKKNLNSINNYSESSLGMISELGILTYAINIIKKKLVSFQNYLIN